jgi:CTP:phosphocholine cytidylyltransferase-like protein
MRRKIGKSWTKRIRKIDGKRRKVKVRKIGGREQIRMFGVRNLTDKSAKKIKRYRKKRYYSATDSGVSRRIRR